MLVYILGNYLIEFLCKIVCVCACLCVFRSKSGGNLQHCEEVLSTEMGENGEECPILTLCTDLRFGKGGVKNRNLKVQCS